MSEFEIEIKEEIEARPPYVLHPVRGAVWAAFWGTFVGAGVVMAINYRRLGNKSAAWTIMASAILATGALFGLILSIPEDVLDQIPNVVFILPQLILVLLIANGLQQRLISEHAARGGAVASAWPSVGLGLLCLPATLGGLLALLLVLEQFSGQVVHFGNDEVYYAGDATEDDARKLGELLQELGYFESQGVTVELELSTDESIVSFVVIDDAWKDPQTIEGFRILGETIVQSGFSSPLTVQLCDDWLAVKNSIRIDNPDWELGDGGRDAP